MKTVMNIKPSQIINALLSKLPPALKSCTIKNLGTIDYKTALAQMQAYTANRHCPTENTLTPDCHPRVGRDDTKDSKDDTDLSSQAPRTWDPRQGSSKTEQCPHNHIKNNTDNQIWLCEHPPIFTLGKFGKEEHILNPGDTPIIKTDRGGQVTYHGPGQLMVYVMFNLKEIKMGPKKFVCQLEEWIIKWLNTYKINATRELNKPGIYVDNAKICALGLCIKHGCTYHGLALNIDMDLEPFSRINPCGYKDQKVINLSSLTR